MALRALLPWGLLLLLLLGADASRSRAWNALSPGDFSQFITQYRGCGGPPRALPGSALSRRALAQTHAALAPAAAPSPSPDAGQGADDLDGDYASAPSGEAPSPSSPSSEAQSPPFAGTIACPSTPVQFRGAALTGSFLESDDVALWVQCRTGTGTVFPGTLLPVPRLSGGGSSSTLQTNVTVATLPCSGSLSCRLIATWGLSEPGPNPTGAPAVPGPSGSPPAASASPAAPGAAGALPPAGPADALAGRPASEIVPGNVEAGSLDDDEAAQSPLEAGAVPRATPGPASEAPAPGPAEGPVSSPAGAPPFDDRPGSEVLFDWNEDGCWFSGAQLLRGGNAYWSCQSGSGNEYVLHCPGCERAAALMGAALAQLQEGAGSSGGSAASGPDGDIVGESTGSSDGSLSDGGSESSTSPSASANATAAEASGGGSHIRLSLILVLTVCLVCATAIVVLALSLFRERIWPLRGARRGPAGIGGHGALPEAALKALPFYAAEAEEELPRVAPGWTPAASPGPGEARDAPPGERAQPPPAPPPPGAPVLVVSPGPGPRRILLGTRYSPNAAEEERKQREARRARRRARRDARAAAELEALERCARASAATGTSPGPRAEADGPPPTSAAPAPAAESSARSLRAETSDLSSRSGGHGVGEGAAGPTRSASSTIPRDRARAAPLTVVDSPRAALLPSGLPSRRPDEGSRLGAGADIRLATPPPSWGFGAVQTLDVAWPAGRSPPPGEGGARDGARLAASPGPSGDDPLASLPLPARALPPARSPSGARPPVLGPLRWVPVPEATSWVAATEAAAAVRPPPPDPRPRAAWPPRSGWQGGASLPASPLARGPVSRGSASPTTSSPRSFASALSLRPDDESVSGSRHRPGDVFVDQSPEDSLDSLDDDEDDGDGDDRNGDGSDRGSLHHLDRHRRPGSRSSGATDGPGGASAEGTDAPSGSGLDASRTSGGDAGRPRTGSRLDAEPLPEDASAEALAMRRETGGWGAREAGGDPR